ncbi:MAG: 4Fe-4S dicluster domain-containing protein [Lysobacterales bacterium]
MTSLPRTTQRKLGLVIDLDLCVGCHACAVACKSWNSGGMAGPLTDTQPYGTQPDGVWFNRVHSYTASRAEDQGAPLTLHFPRSCLHCDNAACVTVCPTGASHKRASDGIVLVDEDKCIGCQLCAWACPYGAREFSAVEGVMKKCTLCVDRIYDEALPEADRQPACVMACPTRARMFGDLADPQDPATRYASERGSVDLLPELGYQPVNRYLPPKPRRANASAEAQVEDDYRPEQLPPLLRWVDRLLST